MFNVSFTTISISAKYFKGPLGHSLLKRWRCVFRMIEAIYCNWAIFVWHLFTE